MVWYGSHDENISYTSSESESGNGNRIKSLMMKSWVEVKVGIYSVVSRQD